MMGGQSSWGRTGGEKRGGSAPWLKTVQWVAGVAGGLAVGVWVVAWVHGNVLSRSDLARFETARATRLEVARMERPEEPPDLPVDTSLWDEGRIEEYKESLLHDFGLPLGVLRIPSIDVAVPILPGTDDVTLNRGAGWIEGTAPVGSSGNICIAAHRDGFFRGFKDLEIGADVVVETLEGERTYVVEGMKIVEPSNVSVLAPTEEPTLTLVTCYPFYFVGSAPQRFVVRAVERADSASVSPDAVEPEKQDDSPGIKSAEREFAQQHLPGS